MGTHYQTYVGPYIALKADKGFKPEDVVGDDVFFRPLCEDDHDQDVKRLCPNRSNDYSYSFDREEGNKVQLITSFAILCGMNCLMRDYAKEIEQLKAAGAEVKICWGVIGRHSF